MAACFVTAVVYAFVAGVNQPVVFQFLDTIIYGILLFLAGYALWQIFWYAIPVNYSPKYRIIFVSVLLFVTSALVIGAETLTVYLCFPAAFDSFVSSVPVRAFISFLIFTILYLSYLVFHENTGDFRDFPGIDSDKIPMDSSNMSDSGNSEMNDSVDSSAIRTVDRITVRIGQKIKIIPVDDILYIKADGDYISIHTAEGSWLKEQTMKYTEDRLPMNNFVRIHRSYIVNVHRISRIERYGEKQQVILNNNEKIKISAARYQSLKQILGI